MPGDFTKWRRIQVTVAELKQERSPLEPLWREIADFLLPYRLMLQLSDQNQKFDRRNSRIIDSAATLAVRTCRAGMMTGHSSPADLWFRLKLQDPDLAEYGPVKEWVDDVTNLMFSVFDRSDIYQVLPQVFGDMAGFMVGAMSIEEDFESVIYARSFPPGSYWFSRDDRGGIAAFYREIRMTVRQLWERFGPDASYSSHVQSCMDQGRWEDWVDVGHLVYPNDEYDARLASVSSRAKRYASCWFELGSGKTADGYLSGSEEGRYLSEKGFDAMPILVASWDRTEGDTYGTDCPGVMSLGDIKSLQLGARRGFQLLDKYADPHWIAPAALEGREGGFLPGRITFLDETATAKLRPLHEPHPQALSELRQEKSEVRQRIYEAFYYDLFRMLDFIDDRQRTAYEIAERKGEKVAQLVPTTVQIAKGILRPMIDRVFEIMMRPGQRERLGIPPPPAELAGQELDVEYVGILAQAQKALQIAPIERIDLPGGRHAPRGARQDRLRPGGGRDGLPPGGARPSDPLGRARSGSPRGARPGDARPGNGRGGENRLRSGAEPRAGRHGRRHRAFATGSDPHRRETRMSANVPRIVIELPPDSPIRVGWVGIPENPVLLFGLLEEAKNILREHFARKAKPDITIVRTTPPPPELFGGNGERRLS